MKRPHHRPSPWMICLVPTLLIGCGPEDPPPSSEEPGEMVADMGMGMEDVGEVPDPDESEDMEEDAPPPDQDDDMGADMPPACEPLEQCPADTCGMVEDTCGGTLDCGACACEDGTLTLTEDACGPCGLGRLTCDAGQTGAATCSIEGDLYGLSAALSEEECASTLLYVDHAASGPQTGEPASPFATYAQAQAEATEGQVIVLARGGPYEEVLDLTEEVSVIGGLSRAQDRWTYDPEGVSGFVAPAPTDDISVGIRALDIQEPTTLAQVRMLAADAPRGWSSYGLMAVDSSGLILERVEAQAGAGGAGRASTSGMDGASGTSGAHGLDYRSVLNAYFGDMPPAGGTNPSCPGADGGAGGMGGFPCMQPNQDCLCLEQAPACDTEWSNHSGQFTSAGTTGNGRHGGAGGIPTISPQADLSEDAQDGQDAASANLGGQTGQAADPMAGRFLRAPSPMAPTPGVGVYWDPGRAESGTEGRDGSGGGGGGGTRFAYALTQPQFGPSEYMAFSGAWGGGGGAGGCAGTPGEGGGTGHASMGAALISSQVTIRESSFLAGPGGRGAPGAQGGRGGQGAAGGSGTSSVNAFPSSRGWGSSGDGGAGSDGGSGGQGGPGAGGVSYGLYCLESLPTLEEASTYEAGAAGQGAQNGVTVLGEPILGPDGEALDQKGCL